MAEQNQQAEQKLSQSKTSFKEWVEIYLDIIIRFFISIFCSILITAILRTTLKLGSTTSLIITIALFIIISPFLGRIRLANKIISQFKR